MPEYGTYDYSALADKMGLGADACPIPLLFCLTTVRRKARTWEKTHVSCWPDTCPRPQGQMSCLASTHALRTRPPTSTELLSRATLSRHRECRSDSLLLCLCASYLILPILLGCEGASVLCWVLHSRPNSCPVFVNVICNMPVPAPGIWAVVLLGHLVCLPNWSQPEQQPLPAVLGRGSNCHVPCVRAAIFHCMQPQQPSPCMQPSIQA